MALTLAGLVIRAGVALNGGLWRDEALLLGVVDIPTWTGMLDLLRFHESHPPLFYAVMRAWRTMFGSGDTAALALPVLLSAALTPVAYAIAAALFDRKTALTSAAFICIAPPLVAYGASVRPYSFLALAVLVSMYCLVVAIESGGVRRWGLHAATVAILIYTHNWAWLVVAGQSVSVAWIALKGVSRGKDAAAGFVVSLLVAGAAFLPWLPAMLGQVANAGHSPVPADGAIEIIAVALYSIVVAVNATVIPPVETGRAIVLVAAAVAVAVLVAGHMRRSVAPDVRSSERSHPAAGPVFVLTPVAATVLAVALSPVTNLVIAACLCSLAAPMIVVIVAFATRSAGSLRAIAGMRSAATLAALVTIAGAYGAGVYELFVRPRSNARELMAEVRAAHRPDDLMIVAPGWLISSVNHYGTGSVNQFAFPDTGGTRLFDFFGTWKRMRDPAALARTRDAIESAARQGRRVWLVTDEPSARGATEDDRKSAMRHRTAARMARVRVKDLRVILTDKFGAPAATIWPMQRVPLQEEMFAERYEVARR